MLASKVASVSEIPDIFFDQILVNYKLSRQEVLVLMYLYRLVWRRPNLHRDYGIGPLLSYNDMAMQLGFLNKKEKWAHALVPCSRHFSSAANVAQDFKSFGFFKFFILEKT